MAAVIRPPFWVPRPSDDFFALALSEPQPYSLLAMLTGGGKPNLKYWPPALVYDDAAHWLIEGPQAPPITLQAPGAAPQLPLKIRFYGYDDPPMWQGAPTDSWLISELTQQAIVMSPLFVPRPGDDPVWSGAPHISDTIFYAVVQAPGVPLKVRFYGYDDPAVWSGSPLASDILLPILTVGGQPPTKRYSPYPIDDPAVWTGSPQLSYTIRPLLTAGGKPPYKEWSYWTLDDPPSWQATIYRNEVALAVPFPPLIARFNSYDDPAFWDARPNRSRIIPEVTEGGQPPTKVYSFYPIDDPPTWQATIYRNTNIATITPEPFIPMGWRFVSNDDPAVWTGSPLHSWIISELTQQTPALPLLDRFVSYDDPAFWVGAPLHSQTLPMLIAGGQPPELIFRFASYDDPSFWQATTYPNLVGRQPAPTPAIPLLARFVIYDEAPSWNAIPLRSRDIFMLTVGGQPPTKTWRYDYDDATVWQPTIYLNITGVMPHVPVIPQLWRFSSYDDAAFWDARPQRSRDLFMLTAGGIPFSNMYQSNAVQGNYDVAETQWQFEEPYNLTLVTALPRPPFNNQSTFFNQGAAFAYDTAEAFWIWVPPRAWAMILPVPPVIPTTFLRPTPYSAFHNFGKMGSS